MNATRVDIISIVQWTDRLRQNRFSPSIIFPAAAKPLCQELKMKLGLLRGGQIWPGAI